MADKQITSSNSNTDLPQWAKNIKLLISLTRKISFTFHTLRHLLLSRKKHSKIECFFDILFLLVLVKNKIILRIFCLEQYKVIMQVLPLD